MPLPYKVKSLDEVDEVLHPYYTEDNGEFTLGVVGAVSKSVLETEQKDRRKAEKALQDAQDAMKKFDGIDPEEVPAMKKQIAELLDAKGKLSFDQLSDEDKAAFRDEQFSRMKKEHESDLARATKPLIAEKEELQAKYSAMKERMVTSSRAARVTELFAGKIDDVHLATVGLYADKYLVHSEEDDRFYTSDDVSDDVWAEQLIKDNPQWLKSNVSGGARGGAGSGHKAGVPTTMSGATGIDFSK